jgi:hypothetical protein
VNVCMYVCMYECICVCVCMCVLCSSGLPPPYPTAVSHDMRSSRGTASTKQFKAGKSSELSEHSGHGNLTTIISTPHDSREEEPSDEQDMEYAAQMLITEAGEKDEDERSRSSSPRPADGFLSEKAWVKVSQSSQKRLQKPATVPAEQRDDTPAAHP